MEIRNVVQVNAPDPSGPVSRQGVEAAKQAYDEGRNERVKGSSSLQKELLQILTSRQEDDAQKLARKQITEGYLDVKV